VRMEREACFAAIGSMTQAMKAQNILTSISIPSTVIKSESSSRRGCIYGLSFPCAYESNVRAALASAKIAVKEWNKMQ